MFKKLPEEMKLRVKLILACSVFLVVIVFAAMNFRSIVNGVGQVIGMLSPIIVGFAFAFLMLPISARIEHLLNVTILKKCKKKKLARGIAAILSLLILAASVVAFSAILIPKLYQSVKSLVDNATVFYNRYYPDLNRWLVENSILKEGDDALKILWNKVIQEINSVTQFVLNNLLTVSSVLYSVAYNLLVGLVAMFYILYGKEKFTSTGKKLSYAFLTNDQADKLVIWTHKTTHLFAGFIRGKLLDSLIIGVVMFLVMCLINPEYALLISIIVGLTNIIPFFGPFIGAIPSILILLMGDPLDALWFTIAVIIIQQLDGNILGPYLLGDRIGLSPLWTMIAIMLGGGLFGFKGMLIGVPVFALIYAIIKALSETRLINKNMSPSTESYDSHFLSNEKAKEIMALEDEKNK